jgi:hypothetical protein
VNGRFILCHALGIRGRVLFLLGSKPVGYWYSKGFKFIESVKGVNEYVYGYG